MISRLACRCGSAGSGVESGQRISQVPERVPEKFHPNPFEEALDGLFERFGV
jgi:hypothetical protein